MSLNDKRFESRSPCVNGSGIAGAARAEDYYFMHLSQFLRLPNRLTATYF
jgi:hypothetical protein